MPTLTRYICAALTLWMVGSRPSATIPPEPAGSSAWRGPKRAANALRAAERYREAGDFAAAEELYQRSYQEAKQHSDDRAAVFYLSGVANCQMVQFHYRAALESYLEAKKLALKIGDRTSLGAVAMNLSSLYQQVGDFDSARRAAEEARAVIDTLPLANYKAQVWLQLARLQESQQNDAAEPALIEGIEAARARGDIALEARAWDLLGEQRLQRGRLTGAERALDEAFRLRVLLPNERGFSYGRLGALKLSQGDLDLAETFTQRSMAEGTRVAASFPPYRLIHQRGRIRLARGDLEGALGDFGAAVDLASRWRLEALPAASSLDGANEWLEKSVFDSLIETGAAEALRKGSPRWAREAFQALELNRSASLRESAALAEALRKKLPPEFWDEVGELRSEEARTLRLGVNHSERADRIRLRLTEMEAEAGLGFPVHEPVNIEENFRSRTSLIHFQQGLGDSELLLSFHLGGSESYLWAVTAETLSLHRLPPAALVRRDVREFREAVRSGHTGAERAGERLYAELFGDLRQRESGKRVWLLSLEDALFELPFAALVTERKGGKVQYLVEQHSLQVIPGALSLAQGSTGP